MSEQAILDRLDTIESRAAVSSVAMRYFRYCDELGPDTPFEKLGQLFASDAVWEGQGRYAKAFGRYEGRQAIVAMIQSYALPTPHFAMTAHFLTAEEIKVAGDEATGHWMMLQTSDYSSGTSDFRSARITIDFVRQGDIWRIGRFLTQNIFSQQTRAWNDEEAILVPGVSAHGEDQ